MLNDLLQEIGSETLYKQIYREIARSWLRAEILTQVRHNEAINQDAIRLPSGE